MPRKNKRNKKSRGKKKSSNAKYSTLASTPSTESETQDGACGSSEPKPTGTERNSSSSSSEDLSLETLSLTDHLLAVPKQESIRARSKSSSPGRNTSQRKKFTFSSTCTPPRKVSPSTQNLLAVPDQESSSTSEGSHSSPKKTLEKILRKVSPRKNSLHSSTNEHSSRNVSPSTQNLLAVPDQESSLTSDPSNASSRNISDKSSGNDSSRKHSLHSSTNEGSSRNISPLSENILTVPDSKSSSTSEQGSSSPRKTFEMVLKTLSPKKKSHSITREYSHKNVSPSTQNLLEVPDPESSSIGEPSTSPKKTFGHAFRKFSPKKKFPHSSTPEHSSRNVSPSTQNLLAVPDPESSSTSKPGGSSPKKTFGHAFRKLSPKKKSHLSTPERSSRNVSPSTQNLLAVPDPESSSTSEPSGSSPKKTFGHAFRKFSPKKFPHSSTPEHSSRNVSPSTQNLLAVPDPESSSTSEPSGSSPKKTFGHAFRKLSPKKKSPHLSTPEHSSRNVSPSTQNLLAVPDLESSSTSEPGTSPKKTFRNVLRRLSPKRKSQSSSDSGCICVGRNHNPECPEFGKDKVKTPTSPKTRLLKSPIRLETSFTKATSALSSSEPQTASDSNSPRADIVVKNTGKTSPSGAKAPWKTSKGKSYKKDPLDKHESSLHTPYYKDLTKTMAAGGSGSVAAGGSGSVAAGGSGSVAAGGSGSVAAGGSGSVAARQSRAVVRRDRTGRAISTIRPRSEPPRLPVECRCRSPYNHAFGCTYWLNIRRRRKFPKRGRSS